MKKLFIISLLTITVFIMGCGNKENTGRVEGVAVPAPSLNKGVFEQDENKVNYVYLPPSYEESDKNYPVLYYLHGYSGNPSSINTFVKNLNSAFEEGIIPEVILVGVNGSNRFSGAFYVNSDVTGYWEDFIAEDLVSYIDSNYRTIAHRDARGIFGFSMGGFGSMNLAFNRPDIFSSLYMQGAGLFDDNGLKQAIGDWKNMNMGPVMEAYGSAFAPNRELEFPHAELPVFDGSDKDNIIIDKWTNGFGNLEGKVEAYMAKEDSLKGITIAYGSRDIFSWIRSGSVHLSEVLDNNGIEHELIEFNGGHDDVNYHLKSRILPFFNEHLAFEG